MPQDRRTKTESGPRHVTIECDVPAGVEDVAAAEVRDRIPSAARVGFQDGKVVFDLARSALAALREVRTIAGAWIVVSSDSRRPIALGSPLVDAVRAVRKRWPDVRAVELSAPGLHPQSGAELRRLIATVAGLRCERGGLLVRVCRRSPLPGWQALVAVAPRPLADRPWRVEPFRGSLNAPLAAAMVRLTHPSASDRFLNLACGSGTIAIERALTGAAATVTGVDISTTALAHAARNAHAARVRVAVVAADGRTLPFAPGSFDVVCTDPPWGHRVGSHEANADEYEGLLVEMARVSRRRARAVVLTNELRLMQRVLGSLAALWRLDRLTRVEQGGARPGLYVLRRA